MIRRWQNRRGRAKAVGGGGFTLVELLVALGVVVVLAGLLMTGIARAKARAQRTVCLNHLSQIGKAMTMYVSDNNKYPQIMGGPPFQMWADRLTPFLGMSWTNVDWHCPVYVAKGDMLRFNYPPPEGGKLSVSSSYAYNANGIWGIKMAGTDLFDAGPKLGLGDLNRTVPEQQVVAPSEMYAVGDARPFLNLQAGGFMGWPVMQAWKLGWGLGIMTEAPPPHDGGYDLLFVDGHAQWLKRRDYLYPPISGPHWNRDNQAHQEMWLPTNAWAVTE
jgi:prepilin-type processing-associated H-X9-DG protein